MSREREESERNYLAYSFFFLFFFFFAFSVKWYVDEVSTQGPQGGRWLHKTRYNNVTANGSLYKYAL